MTSADRIRPTIDRVATWLARQYQDVVTELAPLGGGFWSAAYGYRVGSEAFVLRLSDSWEGFAIDKAAMRFAGPELPVPEVLETGDALGLSFAISRRHWGIFLETVTTDEAPTAGRALDALFAAMRALPTQPDEPLVWHAEEPPDTTWHQWLLDGLIDHPERRVSGWRAKLASEPRMDRLFRTCEERIRSLLPACPERRDLVHGDLLHQNVLVSHDASTVTAIYSWKCSVRGDFLFDVAWCTFWGGGWHPGIAALDAWSRTLAAPDISEAELCDAPARHHCYELQIAASHLGWHAWTGDADGLEAVANRAHLILERGPLPSSQNPAEP